MSLVHTMEFMSYGSNGLSNYPNIFAKSVEL